jgi:hypothetical protein
LAPLVEVEGLFVEGHRGVGVTSWVRFEIGHQR